MNVNSNMEQTKLTLTVKPKRLIYFYKHPSLGMILNHFNTQKVSQQKPFNFLINAKMCIVGNIITHRACH